MAKLMVYFSAMSGGKNNDSFTGSLQLQFKRSKVSNHQA